MLPFTKKKSKIRLSIVSEFFKNFLIAYFIFPFVLFMMKTTNLVFDANEMNDGKAHLYITFLIGIFYAFFMRKYEESFPYKFKKWYILPILAGLATFFLSYLFIDSLNFSVLRNSL